MLLYVIIAVIDLLSTTARLVPDVQDLHILSDMLQVGIESTLVINGNFANYNTFITSHRW